MVKFTKDPRYSTMLFNAVSGRRVKLTRILVEGGADVNISVFGMTPIMAACLLPSKDDENKKFQLVKLLLDNGADLKARDDLGRTALHYAYMGECPIIINLIRSKKRDNRSHRKRFACIRKNED